MSIQATDDKKKTTHKKVGSILYYGRAIKMKTLLPLYTIACHQYESTQTTTNNVNHLLDYLATHPNANIQFYKSDMILNIHSDTSYLSANKARSRGGGILFIDSPPKNNKSILLNSVFHTLCTILPFVAASAAEA